MRPVVIGERFAWAHLPKSGGEATHALFHIFPELIVFADPAKTNTQHTNFRAREQEVRGKTLALNIRRLPCWILSRAQHKARHGLAPDFTPFPMESAREMSETTFPDYRLSTYTDEGRFQIDRWLRMESLAEDFAAFISEFTGVTDDEARRIRELGDVNAHQYDHDIAHWFTSEQIERMYSNNPVWAALEERLYGGRLRLD